jgi:hypothetical protein
MLFDEDGYFHNKHYFEMLLSPRITALTEGFYQQNLVPLVRRFLQKTKDYYKSEQYMQVRKQLLEIPVFRSLLTEVFPIEPEDLSRCVKGMTCFSIKAMCPFTETLTLSFDITARQPYASEKDYRVSFVPTNNLTKVVLVLLRLQKEAVICSSIDKTEYGQLVWLLVILRTIREGLTKHKGLEDWGWHPKDAFKQLHSTLMVSEDALTSVEDIKLDIKWDLAQLIFDCETNQEELLIRLVRFVSTFRGQAACAHRFLLERLHSSERVIEQK